MPETPTETPGEKTLRRFYEGRIADRLIQVASMERNRALLRRGARKMQDGTLGQPGDPSGEEPVNISIGDIHYHQETPTVDPPPGAGTGTGTGPAQPAAETPLWKRAAVLAAIMAATGGSAGLATYLVPAAEKAGEAIAPPGYGVQVEKAPPDAAMPP